MSVNEVTEFDGHLDGIFSDVLCGWIGRKAPRQHPLSVSVLVDGIKLATFEARAYRDDLAKLGYADGYCSFQFPVTELYRRAGKSLLDGHEHAIEVVETLSRKQLPGSPIRFTSGLVDFTGTAVPQNIQHSIRQVLGEVSDFHTLKHTSKQLAIVSTFTEGNFYSKYHAHLFRSLRSMGFYVLAIHTSNSPELFECGLKEEDSPDLILARTNVAYDFGSYLIGLNLARKLELLDREILITNDSSFGPVVPLSETFERMRNEKCDFWGLVDSFEHKYHLQSFFLVFSPSVLNSDTFLKYIENYTYPSNKADVIHAGELLITPMLFQAGFCGGVAFPYSEIAGRWLSTLPQRVTEKTEGYYEQIAHSVRSGVPVNPMHFFWDTLLLDFRCPFLKRELIFKNLVSNPDVWRALGYLKQLGFDISQIKDAAARSTATVKAWPVMDVPPELSNRRRRRLIEKNWAKK